MERVQCQAVLDRETRYTSKDSGVEVRFILQGKRVGRQREFEVSESRMNRVLLSEKHHRAALFAPRFV
uniref:Uncharacterized protein n=1 Tax=Anguilla anguilla TaxID=7936 RepID=A0A0E9Q3H0_ANGAN